MLLHAVNDYLPSLHDLRSFCGVAATAALMTLGGGLIAGRRATPELRLLVGWGALCLVLTLWGVAIPLSLGWVAAGCGLFALSGYRPGALADRGIWRTAALTLPLWLLMLPLRPAEVDTWLNLLPNAAYLVDYGIFPTAGSPPSYSFLPVAPYNTQFVAFAASLIAGQFADNAMSLFNVLLQCAAGLLLARAVAGGDRSQPLPWWACGAGFLLAVPLNPGYVPRVFFASYGEAPLAVTAMFAVWLGADLFTAARRGPVIAREVAALALVLAAMVNIKQSGLGLLLPVAASLLAVGLLCPDMPKRRWSAVVAASAVPALVLYGAWRWFVLTKFPTGELKMLPVAAWHVDLLPQILKAILFIIYEKATYFIAVAAMLGAAVFEARRRPWEGTTIVLAVGAGSVILFNGFLLFMYVAHFDAAGAVEAHSYFRYMSQLSLVVVLALALWLRPWAAIWLRERSLRLRRQAAGVAIGLTVILPFIFLPYLRFDLAAPQPTVWALAKKAGALLRHGDKVALVVPGDNEDALGSMLRGVLLFTPPRRHPLDIKTETAAAGAALADAAAHGYTRAIVSCSPPGGLAGLPPGTAGMVAFDQGAWHPLAVWPYPADLGRKHFTALLPRASLCVN